VGKDGPEVGKTEVNFGPIHWNWPNQARSSPILQGRWKHGECRLDGPGNRASGGPPERVGCRGTRAYCRKPTTVKPFPRGSRRMRAMKNTGDRGMSSTLPASGGEWRWMPCRREQPSRESSWIDPRSPAL